VGEFSTGTMGNFRLELTPTSELRDAKPHGVEKLWENKIAGTFHLSCNGRQYAWARPSIRTAWRPENSLDVLHQEDARFEPADVL
jgi:hypothetical protein